MSSGHCTSAIAIIYSNFAAEMVVVASSILQIAGKTAQDGVSVRKMMCYLFPGPCLETNFSFQTSRMKNECIVFCY